VLIEFIGALLLILVAAELFTNGVEWMGFRMGLGESAVGSLLAAVGTALPETLIPVVSIIFVGGAEGHAVGIGAILGAPFMLSTLAIFMVGASAIVFRERREARWRGVVHGVMFDGAALRRDLGFFIVAYTLAVGAAVVGSGELRVGLGVFLILTYGAYVVAVVRDEGSVNSDGLEDLYFDVIPFFGKGHPYLIVPQVVVSLLGIIAGAHIFVDAVTAFARGVGADPLVVSLLVAPVATELPEKMNSVIWMARGKDHLAVGNITGAMVFQSTFPVSVGLFFTAWSLEPHAAAAVVLALISSVLLYVYSLRWRHPGPLLGMGLLYLVYVVYVLGAA